jgi:transaldolase
MNALGKLEQLGQSIWFDNISRGMLGRGELRLMVAEGLLGVTSNPTIFDKAISGSEDYDEQIRRLTDEGPEVPEHQLIRTLMVDDIRAAADDLVPVFDRTLGRDGFVSVEVSPSKARDTRATVGEARELWLAVNRPNVMIKIPATPEGLPAIEQTLSEGININVTLIFSSGRYAEVAQAYMGGLERRLAAGHPVDRVASVASVFVSRIDTLIDRMLESRIASRPSDAARLRALQGKAAVANSKMVYQRFKEMFSSPRFAALKARGARVQRPLWGSTSTKNPAYDPLLYVRPIVGPDTVNTVPPATYKTILSSLDPESTIERELGENRALLGRLSDEGIDLGAVMQQLEEEGVAAFAASFESLKTSVRAKRQALMPLPRG